jgi:uncharacterized protein (TIGR03067 family)
MRVVGLCVLLFGLAALPRGARADDKRKTELEGTWLPESVVDNGKENKGANDFKLTFKGDTFTLRKGEKVVVRGRFTLDAKKKPCEIDSTITEGPDQAKGKASRGIYTHEGDKLTMCFAQAGQEKRPTEFSAPDGSNHVLFELKRAKK